MNEIMGEGADAVQSSKDMVVEINEILEDSAS